MDGDSLPVSAFAHNPNGEWELGASAYEKRGTAVMVPEWDAEKCIQCNQCAFVCSHATIRPVLPDRRRAGRRPRFAEVCRPQAETGRVQVHDGCFPAGLHGLRRVCHRLPDQGYRDEAAGEPERAAGRFRLLRRKHPQEARHDGRNHRQGFPVQPAAAGVLGFLRRLCRDQLCPPDHPAVCEKMFISNATGCSSIWGGTASISPYTVNKESGHGPAWINSLFEDNAEHGLGMQIGYETVRAT